MIKLFKIKKSERIKPNNISVSLIYNDKGNYTNIILSGNDNNIGKLTRKYTLNGDQTQLFYYIYNSIYEWLCDMKHDEVVKDD